MPQRSFDSAKPQKKIPTLSEYKCSIRAADRLQAARMDRQLDVTQSIFKMLRSLAKTSIVF